VYPDHAGRSRRDMTPSPRPSHDSPSPAETRDDHVSAIQALPHRHDLRHEHPSGPLPLSAGETDRAEDWDHPRTPAPEGLDRVLTAGDRPSSFFDGDDAPTMMLPTRAEIRRREKAAAAAAKAQLEAPAEQPVLSPQPAQSPRPSRWRSRYSRKLRRGLTLATTIGLMAVLVPVVDGTINGAEGAVSGTFPLNPGQSLSADSARSFLDGAGSASFTLPQVPTGGGVYLGVEARADGNASAYRAKVRVQADGSMRIGMSKVVQGSEVTIGSVPIPGQVRSESVVHVQLTVSGKDRPRLSTRSWLDNAEVPDWQYDVVDAFAPSLTEKGTVRAWSYLSRAGSAMSVAFQDLTAQPGDRPTASPAASAEPSTAAPTTNTAKPTPTPTPTSSSSSSSSGGGGSTSSDSAPVESQPTSWPGSASTGVPSGRRLTKHSGNLVITKAGATYDSLDIYGFVDVQAPNVTIRRSIIRGGTATGNRGLITNTTSNATNLLIEDCDLIPTNPTVWLDGVKGANFTVRRVNIDGGVVDGVKVHGNNVVVEDSWIHDLAYYSHDPNQGGGPTHNDGIQVLGGTNITIKHNTITVGTKHNAVMQVTQNYAATKSLSFTKNWVDGGTCSVKLSHSGRSSLGPITVSTNSFGSHTDIDDCAVLRTSKTSLTSSGNIWTSSGSAVSPIVYG
jgi:hypothetical protein